MSLRRIALAVVIVSAVGTARAQGEGGGVVVVDDGNQVKVQRVGGHEARKYAAGYGYGFGGQGLLDQLTYRNTFWIYTGKLSPVYEILDLTDEQRAAMEKIAAEARDAYRKQQQETYKLFRENRDRNIWREMQQKTTELTKKYEARMNELLTDEQREILKKLNELAEKKKETDAKIREVAGLAYAQNKANHEEKLKKLLTEEQLEKLEKAAKAPVTPAWRGRRGGPKRDRVGPQPPADGPGEAPQGGEEMF